MRLAVLRAMVLVFLRDRSALAMAFILPPIFFAVFAMIFANTASGQLTVKTAISVPETQMGEYFVSGMKRIEQLNVVLATNDPEDVTEAVRRAEADAGLIVSVGEDGALRFEIVSDPSSRIATRLLEGAVGEITAGNDPQARLQEAIGFLQDNVITFTPDQQRAIGERLSQLEPGDFSVRTGPDVSISPLSAMERSAASYYAIAVTMLFLFLSALQGALSLIEGRESGIFERLAVSPGGGEVIVDGSFLFLTLQGIAQGAVILLIAWLVFDVPVPGHVLVIGVILITAAVSAAGLSLAMVSLCQSRRQAHSLGTILVLLMGALGGSMAPRILMPEAIQKIGAVTPNAWGIEAFSSVVIRGADTATILPWCVALLMAGIGGMLIARIAVTRY